MQLKMIESMEREKRRNNLIIRGIKETGEDEKEQVDKILEMLVEEVHMKYEIVGRVGRIEKTGNKDRPLRIRMEDVDHKRRLLARGKKLKEGQKWLKKVYLAPDLTKMQQEEDKKLRDMVKEYKTNVRIARGEVACEENGIIEVLFTLKR
jgi:hypothetical protein